MSTDKAEKIGLLMTRYGFNHVTANAWVESNGKCVYCGANMIESLLTWLSAEIDHILPKSTYPDLEWEPLNCVLCCRGCNCAKLKFDPVGLIKSLEVSCPIELLRTNRQELISVIKTKLEPLRASAEETLRGVSDIIEGRY